jgi:hypothetical protein
MRPSYQLIVVGLAALCMTVLGIVIAFWDHVEEPPHDAELLSIGTVALCNLLWLIPWTIVHRKKGDRRMVLAGWLLFALCWFHFPYRYFHHPRFDAELWRSSINFNHSIVGLYPAHKAGYMVPDIIESGVFVGKTKREVEEMLGPHKVPQDHLGYCGSENSIGYFYSGQVLFDGCDKLVISFTNDICTSASYCGCD